MRRRAFPAIVGVVVVLLVGIMVLLILWATRLLPVSTELTPTADLPSVPAATTVVDPEAGGASVAAEVAGVDDTVIDAAWEKLAEVADQGRWKAWARVVNAATGEVILDANNGVTHTPASTMKILTSLFALSTLDPAQTLETGVSLEGTDLYLWGEGDLLLGAGASNSSSVNGRAGLDTLAQGAATALAERGVNSVNLKYQTALFPGVLRPQGWVDQGVTDFGGDVAAYAIDTGRTAPGAWQFVDDSARAVADSFAQSLTSRGINVVSIESGAAPVDAEEISAVASASALEQMEFMLLTSDNTVAEQYCHLAASEYLSTNASLTDSAAAMTDFLSEHGVAVEGLRAYDCSGLDLRNRVEATTLTDAIAISGDASGPAASLVRFFPVGGVSGTLADRFDEGDARGNVAAKTGSLGAVATVSGIVTNESGATLIFAVGADEVPDDGAAWYRPDLDEFIDALAHS